MPDILNHDGHNVPEEISRKLENWNYKCEYTLLNAANYGVPQLRERLFLIAIHKAAVPIIRSSWEGSQGRAGISKRRPLTSAKRACSVARHTPRDYPLFREMKHGEQYPEMHCHAMKRFDAEVERHRLRGERLVAETGSWLALKASMVPPYDPAKFPNKWRKART